MLCSVVNPAQGWQLQPSSPCLILQAHGTGTTHRGRGSRGAGTSAVLHLVAVRLPLERQELGSQRHYSESHLMAAWQWLGSGRHFSAEKITARCGAKRQSFLYLWIHNVQNKTLTCTISLLKKMKRGYFQIPQMTWVLQLEVKELQSLPKMLQ